MLLALESVARSRVQLAKGQMSPRGEGTHLELLREGERLRVPFHRGVRVGMTASRGDVPQQTRRPRLMTSLFVSLRQVEGTLGDGVGALDLVGDEQTFAEVRRPKRQIRPHAERLGEGDAILQESQP